MSVRRGASHSLILGKEDSYNAGAAVPVGHEIPLVSSSLGAYQGPTLDSPELADDLNPKLGLSDTFKTDGQFALATDLDVLGLLFHNMFTSYAVTGAGPYAHVHKIGAADPNSLWMSLGHAHATTPKWDQLYGCYLSGFSCSLKKEGNVLQMPFDVMGSGKHLDDQAAAFDATPTAYTGVRLQPRKAIVAIDGTDVARIREIDFSVKRDIQGDRGLNNLEYENELIFGGFTCEIGKLVATWDHASTLRALEDGASHAVRIRIYETATYLVEFLFQEVLFPRTDKSNVGDRGPLTYTHTGLKPGYDVGAAASAVQITVTNGVATYATAW